MPALLLLGAISTLVLSCGGRTDRAEERTGECTPPSVVTTLDLPDQAWDIAIWNGHLFVTGQYWNPGASSSLLVLDISRPDRPDLVARVDLTNEPMSVSVANGFAFVAALDAVAVVDVSSPDASSVLGTVPVPQGAYDLAVSGDRAYSVGASGLHVIDVSEKTAPRVIGQIAPADASLFFIAVSGERAFVTDSTSDLLIFDLGAPEDPVLLAQVSVGISPNGNWAYEVAASDDVAYVANADVGLAVIDTSRTELEPSVRDFEYVTDVHLAQDLAYVTDGMRLQVVDVSWPDEPVLLGTIQTPDQTLRSVSLSARHAFATAGGYGTDGPSTLVVIDLGCLAPNR